jgi:drug/metabolite transporter (DMT)-like permease
VATTSITRVVLWMTGGLVSFSAMAISIRLLSAHLNLFEVLTIRSGIGMIIMLTLLAIYPRFRAEIRPHRMKLTLFRNGIHFVAQFMWASALTLLPFATVFALEFIAPAWTALLAVWVLGEKLTVSRIGVVVLGLAGVLIILRPGLETFNPGALFVLLATLGYACVYITTKMLTKSHTTFAIIFWMMVIQLPLGLLGSDPLFPLRLQLSDIPATIALGVAGATSHLCLSNAFRAGDATLVVPLDFLRVPLIAVVGWMFFGERLDLWVFVGVLVILAGILWNLRQESRRIS